VKSLRLAKMYCLLSLFFRDGKPPNFATKAILGVIAGGVGSFIGTPAEISLIRMTSDGR
jgi:solute carrier family 25 (mitochondrial oxoglutarate transporter), member 11